MCGISGIINQLNQQVSLQELKGITDPIRHRGPDDEGYHAELNFGFGHRRLAILDLSADGHQPMPYLNRYVITYNGEVYNYLELKEELLQAGYHFKSKTDTEVILASYDRWGEQCVEKFNGMWAFAIYDRQNQQLFCSRDRFGVKPFYYVQMESKFAIGSEIKQFTGLQGWEALPNLPRLLDFFVYGVFNHTDQTLFQGVFQLKAGHNLLYDLREHQFKVQKWYHLPARLSRFTGTFAEATTRFQALFQDAVRLRLRSDVKVGSCLSGGLDSSSIVCSVHQLLKEKGDTSTQETVSSCFHQSKYDEQEFIDEVIAHTGVRSNKVFPEFDQLFQVLEDIVWHQDEPFGSTSIFAQWCVFKEAKKRNLIVMLDGQGADESLAGYPIYYEAFLISLSKKLRLGRLLEEWSEYKKLPFYSPALVGRRAIKCLLPGKIISRGRAMNTSHEFRFLRQKFRALQLEGFTPKFFPDILQLSVDQLTLSHLPMLLHYEDRDSMAHSIEARVPFLDYRLVEFILSLPDEYKISRGKTKNILREALSALLPKKIKERKDKMAFVTPEGEWMEQNRNIFRDKLREAGTFFQDFIDGEALLDSFDQKSGNKLVIGSLYWRLIIMHAWALRFNVVPEFRFNSNFTGRRNEIISQFNT
jgi:asparagine synthase (glutamine-hydrolysing)